MRKITIMHEFWTWDSNPYLSDSNRCLLESIFLIFWNLDSNPYLWDSNRLSYLAFCSFLEIRFWQHLSIYFWHSKSAWNNLELTKKCLKHRQKCPSFSECRYGVSSFKVIRIANKKIRITLPCFSFLHFLELRFESYP